GLGLFLAVLIALAVHESDYHGCWHAPLHGTGSYAWIVIDVIIAAFHLRGWERLYPFACLGFLALAYICYTNFNAAMREEREAAATNSVPSSHAANVCW